jgi:hypothetical protein
MHRGVWLSNVPLDAGDGFSRQISTDSRLLLVKIPRALVSKYEWVDEGKPPGAYREWLVPAALLNKHAQIRVATEAEEAAGFRRRFGL